MELSLRELAARLGARVEGDPETRVDGLAAPAEAGPRDLVFAEDDARLARALAGPAAAILTGERTAAPAAAAPPVRPLVRAANPRLAFARALALLRPAPAPEPGIHPSAVVGRGVELGAGVAVGPLVVLGDGCRLGARVMLGAGCVVGSGCRLGDDTRLYPNVVLYDGVTLGRRVIVHAGAILGADGFGYVRDGATSVKIPQTGTVEIGDDVEIGANTTIDRATLGATRVGPGSKLDNLVQVAHNVELGAGCVVAAQVGISGSSRIGDGVTLAGQVGIGDHATVEDGVIAAGQSGILTGKRVPARAVVWGTPARPIDEAKRQQAALARLPDLLAHVRALERRVRELEGHHSADGR